VLITAPFNAYASAPADSIKASPGNSLLKSKVAYKASDSIRFNIVEQKVYLFGNADVKYEDISLTASYIELDLNSNLVHAKFGRDSTGKKIGIPKFEQNGTGFSADSIKYNFETKKGKISDVITKEGEGFIHGKVVKKDTNNVFYIKKGRYTTCDLEHPHFFIGADKLKVIPDDKIITGPAYLSIADVPTPLVVPFGFFPNKKGQSSGIIVPTYGKSQELGFALRDGGYYFGINDYMDMAIKGDIYSYGSWGLKTLTNYKKKYKYDGSFNLNYARILTGIPETPDFSSKNDFFVRWSHTQNPKAKPGRNFSANVNGGSSNYNKYNSTNSRDYLTNTFQSNVNYNKTFNLFKTQFNFSASARHSQNTNTKIVDLSLPELALASNRIFPFKNSNRIGAKWYDKIGFSWTSTAVNSISTYDSLLFKERSLDIMRNAMRHTVPISTSFNILKYFTLTPSISASSVWYLKTINKTYNADSNKVYTDTVNGFRTANEASASANLTTKLYGTYQFRHGTLKAIRHLMIPSVGVSYRPDYSNEKFGYYQTVDIDKYGKTEKYSVFQNGIYGSPGSGKSGNVNMSLSNTVEMKLKPKEDTSNIDRKVPLIQAFNISTSYNMAAEHFKWALINLNGRTMLFKKLDVNASAALDPYRIDTSGKRIERWEWTANQRIGRLTNVGLNLGTSLQSKERDKKESKKGTEQELEYINAHPNEFVDFSVPWTLSLYYSLQYSKPQLVKTVTQALSFSGDCNITKNWKIGFRSGYDFVQKDFTYTSVDIYRDLHCWEMSFNWVPFGLRQSYNVSIKVKAAVLQDLKLNRKREWYDFQ